MGCIGSTGGSRMPARLWIRCTTQRFHRSVKKRRVAVGGGDGVPRPRHRSRAHLSRTIFGYPGLVRRIPAPVVRAHLLIILIDLVLRRAAGVAGPTALGATYRWGAAAP